MGMVDVRFHIAVKEGGGEPQPLMKSSVLYYEQSAQLRKDV